MPTHSGRSDQRDSTRRRRNHSQTSGTVELAPREDGQVDETETFIESLRTEDSDDDSWITEPRASRPRHADYPPDYVPDLGAVDGVDLEPADYPIRNAQSRELTEIPATPPRRTNKSGHDSYQAPDNRVDPARVKPTVANLTEETVLRRRREHPAQGWRRAVYTVTGGAVNPGPSKAEVRLQELIDRACAPLHGCHRLAVISLKGGVGKTTTTVCLGSMFATLRGDRVVAMDANPDRGTLGEKVPRTSSRTVRDLVNNAARLARYADVREFTTQAPSRLEVLASDGDPFVSMAFSEGDYRIGMGVLESYYNLILTDCGTGLLHSAMVGVLGLADSLIVISSASLDGARSASATLDWLEHHGYNDLVRSSVAVISTVHPEGGNVDIGRLEEHFSARCRTVARIPFDRHLQAGGIIDLDELDPPTYYAYLELAAAVAAGF